MGKGSFNGGGTMWSRADFVRLPDEGQPNPSTPSQYARLNAKIRFAQRLPAMLAARRLELVAARETAELELLDLWLSDLATHHRAAAEYVKGGMRRGT